MRPTIALVLICIAGGLLGCQAQKASMWEMKCSACHDGKTLLNEQVVKSRDQLRTDYSNLDQFTAACDNAPACMAILKHDKGLMKSVGQEIGISARK